jgi:hypothetical protein
MHSIGSPRIGIQTQESTLQKPGENHQSKVNKKSQLSHIYKYADSLNPGTQPDLKSQLGHLV